MITIIKDIEKNVLVLPSIPYEYLNVELQLHSDFSNKDYIIPLVDDVAIHPQRHSEFEVTSIHYSMIESGLYQFSLKADGDILSIGMCKIKSLEPTINYPSIKPVEDDDYKVFN